MVPFNPPKSQNTSNRSKLTSARLNLRIAQPPALQLVEQTTPPLGGQLSGFRSATPVAGDCARQRLTAIGQIVDLRETR